MYTHIFDFNFWWQIFFYHFYIYGLSWYLWMGSWLGRDLFIYLWLLFNTHWWTLPSRDYAHLFCGRMLSSKQDITLYLSPEFTSRERLTQDWTKSLIKVKSANLQVNSLNWKVHLKLNLDEIYWLWKGACVPRHWTSWNSKADKTLDHADHLLTSHRHLYSNTSEWCIVIDS